ncbi:tautomerase family protein [Actibacterium sp. 188UL27-1]|uniref:tautomerase family protein n=1 Tax=Actibacterium sp. 188UL27-1 TaxID=2786961 RepID=UPI0019594E86|nr:tautomerase family protein [Actibacterium sp. 188UL27-1]MBM7070385.1 tautomerase family protein [Actibacterium sp. 188UL27-1]
MPTIRVTVSQSAWSKDEKAQLVAKLTDGLNDVAGASGKGDIKRYINVHTEETAEGGYAMGGQMVG